MLAESFAPPAPVARGGLAVIIHSGMRVWKRRIADWVGSFVTLSRLFSICPRLPGQVSGSLLLLLKRVFAACGWGSQGSITGRYHRVQAPGGFSERAASPGLVFAISERTLITPSGSCFFFLRIFVLWILCTISLFLTKRRRSVEETSARFQLATPNAAAASCESYAAQREMGQGKIPQAAESEGCGH